LFTVLGLLQVLVLSHLNHVEFCINSKTYSRCFCAHRMILESVEKTLSVGRQIWEYAAAANWWNIQRIIHREPLVYNSRVERSENLRLWQIGRIIKE
jgi:hypothetical protein